MTDFQGWIFTRIIEMKGERIMKELIVEEKTQEEIQAKVRYMNGGAGGFSCHCES